MKDKENNMLPSQWECPPINDISANDKNAIVDGPFGSNLKVSDYDNKGKIPVISITNINEGYDKDKLRFITKSKFETIKRSAVNAGDIIMAKIGSSYGKCGFYPDWMPTGMIPANMLKIKISPHINKNFVFNYLQSSLFKKKLNTITKSTAQPAFNVTAFRKLTIPIPPFPEQIRIQSKIDELTTRLDSGIESLKQVQILLKQYRLSVLKSAIEGKLTSEWRKQHKNDLEPADELLARILKERKEKWEDEKLAEFKAKGKKPPKNWLNKYKRPIIPNTNNLPGLPEGWIYLPLIEVATLHRGYDLPKHKRVQGKFPVVASSSVVGSHNEIKVKGPGVITGRSGTIGKVLYIKEDYWPLNTTLYVCDFHNNHRKYISYFLEWFNLKKYLAGTGVPTLNRNLVHPIIVPVPPIAEQKIIAESVEEYLSIIDKCEKSIESEIHRSQSLRQSILKKAFEGKLVPQGSNDEPASVLLERIKTEKAKLNN